MTKSYYAACFNRCRVPASSVCFGVGEWMEIVWQLRGKGTIFGDETRRSRKAASRAKVFGIERSRQSHSPVPFVSVPLSWRLACRG